MNKEFLREVADCLSDMIDFADDNAPDRNDLDYAYYFEKLDYARDVLKELDILLEGGDNNE